MDYLSKWIKNVCRSDYPLYLYGSLRSTFQGYWNEKFENNEFEATEIIENLWLGNIASATNRKQLLAHDIKNIVVTAIGVRQLFSEINYVYIPLRDTESEFILSQIKQILPQVHDMVLKAPTLVHCMVGASRSATLVICYLMRFKRINLKDSLALVKDKRPIVDPNSGYLKQLQEFEKELIEEGYL